jgi:hypothetical protein
MVNGREHGRDGEGKNKKEVRTISITLPSINNRVRDRVPLEILNISFDPEIIAFTL